LLPGEARASRDAVEHRGREIVTSASRSASKAIVITCVGVSAMG
jgi:hypothetical protein